MNAQEKQRGKSPVIIAVCGVKNSGKTTLLVNILPMLREKGLKAAVIKHDGHDFVPDVAGTDSYRLRNAGALGVAVYSSNKFMLVREGIEVSADDLSLCFQDMDLILLEGGKNSCYPKLEVARAGISDRLMSDPDTLLALCADTAFQFGVDGVPRFDLTDYHGIVDLITRFHDSC